MMVPANQYETLFSPGRINRLELKNRIIFPPMAFSFNHTSGETSDKTIEAYARRARGGCGMLMPVHMFADPFEKSPARHRARPHAAARHDAQRASGRMKWASAHWSEERNPRLYDLIDAVHDNGATLCISLAPDCSGWADDYNAARPAEKFQRFGLFNRLTPGEIEAIVEEFANVAGWLRASGVDAVELHMSTLAHYFLSPEFNQREDGYGGDLEGRLRFTGELIRATRTTVGADFPLIYMMMMEADAASKAIARQVEAWGIDAFRARGGTFGNAALSTPSMYHPDGVHIEVANCVAEVLRIPVIAGSKLGDPSLAEAVLAAGKADFVAIGRPLVADPEWPNKVRSHQAERVRKCIWCNIGCLGRVTDVPRKTSRCTVNPLFGNEEKIPDLAAAAVAKKVVVVGGGPAGMSAALTAARRGHRVVLFERAAQLGAGGQFALALVPPFKHSLRYVPDYYRREFAEFPALSLRLNTAADADAVLAEAPDAVIVATGASAQIPSLPGADAPEVLSYTDVLLGSTPVGDNVVITGGGNVGCETALYLLAQGKRVTILEACDRLADDVNENVRSGLLGEIEKAGAVSICGALVTALSGGRASYVTGGETRHVNADTVVLALGSKPENQLYHDLGRRITSLYLVGDAKQPRQIMEAVSEGFHAARYI